MSTTETPIFHQTLDFDNLMQAARRHITSLAGKVWSNHNGSDPGITQLEVLAFCIADLSYRTSFPIKDILTGYNGNLTEKHDLPLADIALPNHPVTIKDLRKVLIDMGHPKYLASLNGGIYGSRPYPTKLLVRNAFPIIAEGTEIEFFAVSRAGKDAFLTFDTSYESDPTLEQSLEPIKELTTQDRARPADYDPTKAINPALNVSVSNVSSNLNALDASAHQSTNFNNTKKIINYENIDPIVLNGLYALQIEFENDVLYDENHQNIPFLYDLNQNYFEDTITTLSNKNYQLSVLMPYWDDINWQLRNVNPLVSPLNYDIRNFKDYFIAVDKLNYDDYFYDYYAEVLLNGFKLQLFAKVQTAVNDVITVHGKTYEFEANFLDWNELSNGCDLSAISFDPSGLIVDTSDHALQQLDVHPTQQLHIENIQLDGEVHLFDLQSCFSFNKIRIRIDNQGTQTQSIRNKKINLLTRISFAKGITIPHTEIGLVMNALKAKFHDLLKERIALEIAVKAQLLNNQSAIYSNYHKKINQVFEYLYEGEHCIWSYLGQYRNLGEDFSKFSASRIQEIALFGKLLVAPNHNINELLAEVYFQVDQFLNPLVKFNSLSEMVDKGYQFEDLFNGPLLQNGFIEDADLENLKRRSVVYTSDLIRIIMNVTGVLAVEDFNISSYIDNRLMGRNVINCLNLTNSDIYKPRFSGHKTVFEIWVDGKVQETDVEFIQRWYLTKIRDAKVAQLSARDFTMTEIPTGTDREIGDYYSVQHDFPEIYGIGNYGLPADATAERKARAKQLKAYLLPYEQLLTNYLKQIAHLPELFSYHRDIQSTYATQPLYDVPDVQPLFADFAQSTTTWADFTQNLNNGYQLAKKTDEGTDVFRNRRNRFLSHLLSRFGESFEAYATQMFDAHKNLLNDPNQGITAYRTAQADTMDKLISDKIAFAEDYQKVSAQRYKAFNTTLDSADRPLGLWNNANIAAYKLRLCRLLGIEQANNAPIFQVYQDVTGEWIDAEGMHVVEHILLRPRTKLATLLDLTVQPAIDGPGTFIFDADKDPYSFIITIVLPKNAGRFKNEKFRDFTERLIHIETPAHIRVNFKWMNGECGQKFEKHYRVWKQNTYKLKPHFFQNVGNDGSLDLKNLLIDPIKVKLQVADAAQLAVLSKKSKISRDINTDISVSDKVETVSLQRTSILTLQDNLVHALSASCELKLSLYNATHQAFQPINGTITFEHKKTDVFHLKVSEIGGTITVYKLNTNNSAFEVVADFQPIKATYFNVNLYLNGNLGLTEQVGGVGLYKVVYEVENKPSISQLISVTKAPIPVEIVIGWTSGDDGSMLAFNTSQDGVFRISNKNWLGYFLQFQPTSVVNNEFLTEKILISSPSKGLAPTALNLSKTNPKQLLLSDIYNQFGFGTYHVTYELDGQTTFAEIELFLEVSIRVFDRKLELFPTIENVIAIPSTSRKIDLLFELPGGKLKIYDFDNGVAIQKDRTLNDRFENVVALYKNVSNLLINRDLDSIFEDGRHYLFSYELLGVKSQVILFFPAPELETPTVKLFHNGKEMTNLPFIIQVDPSDLDYKLEFHPKNALLEAWVINQDQKKIIDSFNVTQDFQVEKMSPIEVFGEHGAGPIFIQCSNAKGIADLSFSFLKPIPVEIKATSLSIQNSATKELSLAEGDLFTLIFDYKNPKQEFNFEFNNGNGVLKLTHENGTKTEIKVAKNSISVNGISDFPTGLISGDYTAEYVPKEGKSLPFKFRVINLNPTFKLTTVGFKSPTYSGTALPLYPTAQTYIWRVNGVYVSRAKKPVLDLTFGKMSELEIELTMHLHDVEASSKMNVTPAILKELINAK